MARSTTTKSSKTPTKTTKPVAAKATKSALPKTRKPAPAKVAAKAAPETVVVQESVPTSTQPELKKVELIDMVVERAGVKKRDAKPAIEAALEILGAALAEGREVNMQPLGKIRVNRMKHLSSARVMTCKVRQTIKDDAAEKPLDDDPVAEAAE